MEKNIKREQLIPSFKEIREKYKNPKEALGEYFKMAKKALQEVKGRPKDILEEEIKTKK
jgi:cytochrome c551/c552